MFPFSLLLYIMWLLQPQDDCAQLIENIFSPYAAQQHQIDNKFLLFYTNHHGVMLSTLLNSQKMDEMKTVHIYTLVP